MKLHNKTAKSKFYWTKANYRTNEQFYDIIESALNGQWKQAIKQTEEYGFYASDLMKKQNAFKSAGLHTIEDIELCILSEGAEKLRHNKSIVILKS
jgi:hypothetical protein